jgi:hypothetical protein
MLSAFIHIIGDTLRTIAMLIAAGISSIFKIDGDITDAWSAVVASFTILLLCGRLIHEIRKSLQDIHQDEAEFGEEGGIEIPEIRLHPSSSSSSSSIGNSSGGRGQYYMKVAKTDIDDENLQ